ncbi:MAG: outer membrane lipoprotein carrier protein LolA [Deltaproteobacteria bacterium]|nr:outer membrane lipoprotein carrier protein LolA [Deltaproteobacteria bacterium]
MKRKIILIFCAFVLINAGGAFCESSSPLLNEQSEKSPLTLDEIIDRVEERYNASGFFARFSQKSTLKAMEITDFASGSVLFKRPGMMRWEYEKPEIQEIITDGKTLWIFRREDNQVMIGKAASYFGDGKGGSFLSDIKLIRKKFRLSLEKKDNKNYVLKLLPMEKKLDLSAIYLSISKKTFDIIQIVTYNSYGDETIIEFGNVQFKENIDDSKFKFEIPHNADILELD